MLQVTRDGFVNRVIALSDTLLLISVNTVHKLLLSSSGYMSQAAHLLVVQCSRTLENLAVLFEPMGPRSFPAPTLCAFMNTNC